MNEFKNNKESKLKELKGDISKQKSALSKHAAELKILGKQLQTATIELGECFILGFIFLNVFFWN